MRIVQISDTHISHLGGITNDNFSLIVDFVNKEIRPDLVVNTGDIVLLDPDIAQDREEARVLHAGFEAPVRMIPGNHDIGEGSEHPWMGMAPTTERLNAHKSVFGSDRFLELVDDTWAIIGINSEILSSGLSEEEDQWNWLESVAQEIQGRSVLFFLHRPMWSPLPDTEHKRTIGESDRDRILAILQGSRFACVGSGHVHVFANVLENDIRMVAAPSTAFILHTVDRKHAFNQLGVVEYRIEGNEIEAYFRAVPQLVEGETADMEQVAVTLKNLRERMTADV